MAGPVADEGGQLIPSTQYEMERDGNFAHLAYEDADDLRATQKILARRELIGENHAADNGIIESVTMINFMCHEKLHVTLGPLINFIIGENGSGKSAILTAITLCLGGKASMTNRGGSLKSFIKEGRDQCQLVIRLKNQEPGAYQHEVYGDVIVVERVFSKSGTSGFRLRNETNRQVSTKKADVDEVIEYFQMQIDNPMNVLTQDAARQFLNRSTPADKYKFFVKGVQLEQLDNDYRLVSETADAMEEKLSITRGNVKALGKAAAMAEEKVKLANQHAGMRGQLTRLGKQMAWAQVEEVEAELSAREVLVTSEQAHIIEAEELVKAKDQVYEQANQRSEILLEKVKTLTDGLIPLKEEEADARANFEMAAQEAKNAHLEHRKIRDAVTAAHNKVKTTTSEINDELQRMENANGGEHTRKLEELAVAQQDVTNIRGKLEECAAQRRVFVERRQEKLEQFQHHEGPLNTKKDEIIACQRQLDTMRRESGQLVATLDPKVSQLLDMIRTERGFKEKPIGPIGQHIKLLKPAWANVLDKTIGNLLNGFIVTSKPDQELLSRMMRNIRLDFAPIVIGNHAPLQISGHEPDEQYDTVLRVLEIDNDLVTRQLIISQAIEQTILIERREDAMNTMYKGPRPTNVKQCFCIGTRRGWGLRLGFMSGTGDPTSGPIQPTGRKARMKTDLESQIAYQNDTLEHLRQELLNLQKTYRESEHAVQKCDQLIKQHVRAHQELGMTLQRAEDRVERIQVELDQDNIEDGRLEGLKLYLAELEEDARIQESSYGAAVMAKENQNNKSHDLKKIFDNAKAAIAQHEIIIKKAESKVKTVQAARQLMLQEKNAAIEKVEELQLSKDRAEQRRDRQRLRVEDFTKKAMACSPRVPVDPGETASSLDKKLEKLNKSLESYNRRLGGTDEQINLAFEEAKVAHNKAEEQLAGLEELLKLLKSTYLDRLDMWRKFQRYISARSRMNFTYLLSERGFRGKLKLDHKNFLLDLNIEPDDTVQSSKGRNTKTLSGGEKSFSSICLLLALWEAMGSPLRCLDEFDVFMDNVNRDVSTKMIVSCSLVHKTIFS
jgi:chromosome segregation ATPase